MPHDPILVRPTARLMSLGIAAIAMTSMAAGLVGCDQSQSDRTQNDGAETGAVDVTTDQPETVGPTSDNPRRERTSTLGRALDTAERTRDQAEARDAELGKMADEIFE